MARPLRLGTAALALLVTTVLLLPAVSDAQPLQQATPNTPTTPTKTKGEWYVQDKRATSAIFKLPDEPAIPSGCAKPTKAQCVDEAFWKTNTCAAAPANDPRSKAIKAHCTWQMQKAWTTAGSNARPTVFPTTNPTTAFPSLASGRRIEHGRLLPFTTLPTGATKRGYSKRTSPTKASTAATAPRGTTYTPRSGTSTTPNTSGPSSAAGAGGTYASQQMVSIVGQQAQIESGMTGALDWGPAVNMPKATQLNDWIMAKPPFVGPGAGVNSCNEYGYKRWGNWSSFQYAAKRMNRWYRNIYKIAMDPESPVFINQDLKQVGTVTRIPIPLRDVLPGEKLWREGGADGNGTGSTTQSVVTWKQYNDPFIPKNAFYSVPPDWVGIPNPMTGNPTPSNHVKLGISLADADKIRNAYASRRGEKIKAKNGFKDADPFAMHRDAKQRLDSVYGNPLDEELADMSKRTGAYLELASRRVTLLEKDACSLPNDPCYLCRPRPPIPPGVQEKMKQGLSRPAGIQKVLEQAKGWDVINPNPYDMGALFNTSSALDRTRALVAFEVAGGAIAELATSVGRGALGGNAPTLGGAKQKGIDVFGQVVKPGGASGVSNNGAQTAFGACVQEMMAAKPFITSAIDQIEKDLTRLVLNEINNPKGCLVDPGPNNTNACDWNYEYFASLVSDLYSSPLERDVSICTTSVGNSNRALNTSSYAAAFTTVKSASKQPLIFPCIQRRDFSVNAPQVENFIKVNGSVIGQQCEVEVQNQATKDLQSQYADYFKGMEWDAGSGKVSDKESNTLRLGSDLGAEFNYDTAWELQQTQSLNNDSMKGCRFEGAASQTASAKIHFFGDSYQLMSTNGEVKARSNPGRVKHQASWVDLDSGETKYLKPPAANNGRIDRAFLPDESVGRFLPPMYLADEEYSYWIVIAEFPVKITFGFSASAGMTFTFAGRSGDNCSDASLKAPTRFRLALGAMPYVQADAFADASLNYPGVASAGVRLDLTLLRLGLPVGLDISNTVPESWSFRVGGKVSIDMLSGSLSAYVSAGAPPLEVTFWAKIMDWDGFHEDFAAWGLDRAVPSGGVRALLAKFADRSTVACVNDNKIVSGNVSVPGESACSNWTHPDRPIPASAPCPAGGCPPAQLRKVNGKPEWHLCRFSEHDRNRLTVYKDACKDFTR